MEASDHRTPGRIVRRLVALAGGALIAGLCAAAAADRSSAAERRGGRVGIRVPGDVSSFNIYTATNALSQGGGRFLLPKPADGQDGLQEGPPTLRPSPA